jgi:hypothetical protein
MLVDIFDHDGDLLVYRGGFGDETLSTCLPFRPSKSGSSSANAVPATQSTSAVTHTIAAITFGILEEKTRDARKRAARNSV